MTEVTDVTGDMPEVEPATVNATISADMTSASMSRVVGRKCARRTTTAMATLTAVAGMTAGAGVAAAKVGGGTRMWMRISA